VHLLHGCAFGISLKLKGHQICVILAPKVSNWRIFKFSNYKNPNKFYFGVSALLISTFFRYFMVTVITTAVFVKYS